MIVPSSIGLQSIAETPIIFFVSKIVAPKTSGKAKIKENLATFFFSIPRNNPVDIVLPLREIPGIIATA